MKHSKIISAILSLSIIASQASGFVPNVTAKPDSNALIAYAYTENVSGNWIKDKDTGKWWYKHTDGSYTKNSWEKIKDLWYHFDIYGWMQTGWLKDGDKWFYLNSNGAMHTGWKEIDGNWYYFNPNGDRHTGWKQIQSNWYYFNTDGVMQKDWLTINNNKYYFNSDGVMQKYWQQINNKWYYFNSEGIMQKNWYTDSKGNKYNLGTDGVMRKDFCKIGNDTYYFGENYPIEGIMQKGWQTINNKEYYFNSDGVMQKKDQYIDGKNCYFNTDGVRLYPTIFDAPVSYTVIEESGVNVYSSRSADSKVLTSAPINRACYVYGIVGNWAYVLIRGNNGQGYEGWVYKYNLSVGLQYEIVVGDGLKLRKAPDKSDEFNVIRAIPKGEIVTYYNVPGDEYHGHDGHKWIKVKYKEDEGWICYYYNKDFKEEKWYAKSISEW
jgi:glucan-binding YG repeat protein